MLYSYHQFTKVCFINVADVSVYFVSKPFKTFTHSPQGLKKKTCSNLKK